MITSYADEFLPIPGVVAFYVAVGLKINLRYLSSRVLLKHMPFFLGNHFSTVLSVHFDVTGIECFG